jgi:hypothetical protein
MKLKIILIGSLLILLTGCEATETSTRKEAKAQELLNTQAINSVGMPAITNFSEKKNLKMILELRDKNDVVTYTYIMDLNGKPHKICDSIGYGIPYATQFTNPMRSAKRNETYEEGNIALPQADPNGLYSPASADGTWVNCLNPVTKKLSPTYIEPRIVVTQFPLK